MKNIRSFPLIALGVFCATGLVCTPTRAQLVFTVQNVTVSPGGTGYFDVTLTNPGAAPDASVASFSFELSGAGTPNISFTSVDAATSAPYIFGTLQSTPFSYDTFPNTTFTASDVDFAAPSVTLTGGETVGVGRVGFTAAPGSSTGGFAVSFMNPGGTTSLNDENGKDVPFTTTPGTIIVASAPEPSPLAALGFGLLGVGGLALRARRKLA